jgi:PAS domain S-box-containing protein
MASHLTWMKLLLDRAESLSMRAKLTIAFSTLIAIQTVIFWIYFPSKLEEYAVSKAREKVESIAAMTASALGPAVYFDDHAGIDEALQLARKNKDLAFLIVERTDGNIHLQYNPMHYEVDDIFSGSEVTRDRMVCKVRTGISSVGRPVGRLVVGLSLRGVYANVEETRGIITFLSIVLLLLGTGLAAGFSTVVTRPLRLFVQTVNTVSPTDLTTRAEVPSQQEVAQLAIAFNRMLGRINEQTETIRAAEAKFRTLVEQIPTVVYTSTLDSVSSTLYISPQVERYLGYTAEELVRTPSLWHDAIYGEDRPLIDREMARCKAERGSLAMEYRMVTRDGRIMWWEDQAIVIQPNGDGRSYLQGVMSDITARKEAEEKLQASLAEKEVLLKEIHHRVKNNLQVISSLLFLQSRMASDPHIVDVFLDSQNRVRSMALIHEQLYRSTDFGRIDFDHYLRSLTTSIARGLRRDAAPITLRREAPEVFLSIDMAIPCGLLINELVTNAFKHAFPDGRAGTVEVLMKNCDNGTVALTVTDDGIGLSETVNPETAESLGLKLVQMLSSQLGGTIEVNRSPGTTFRVVFPRDGVA